jgi:hypothetical protein
MEEYEICPYKEKHTNQTKIYKNNFLSCNIGNCPYDNLKKITLGGEGTFHEEVCKTKGLIKKLEQTA